MRGTFFNKSICDTTSYVIKMNIDISFHNGPQMMIEVFKIEKFVSFFLPVMRLLGSNTSIFSSKSIAK